MQTRKQFLINSISIATGTVLFGFKEIDNVQSQPAAPYLTFDLHCHPGRLFEKGTGDFKKIVDPEKTLREMNSSHLSGAFFTLVADSKIIELGPTGVIVSGKYKPGEAWQEYKRQLKDMKHFFQRASVRLATQANDLKQSDSVTAYIAVEGGDFLEGHVEKLDEVYNDGVRSIQLVHYAPK
jgi:membrane dipeptidase